MSRRIGIWAVVGLLVAVGWAVYAGMGPQNGFNLGHSDVVALTIPIAFVGRHMRIGVYTSVVANAVTYALIGLMWELAWRGYRSRRMVLR